MQRTFPLGLSWSLDQDRRLWDLESKQFLADPQHYLCVLRVGDHDVGATEVHCEDKWSGEHHLRGHLQYAAS